MATRKKYNLLLAYAAWKQENPGSENRMLRRGELFEAVGHALRVLMEPGREDDLNKVMSLLSQLTEKNRG